MSIEQSIFAAMKAASWERAKGELRALVAIKGCISSDPRDTYPLPYQQLETAVEEFIREIEDNALQE